MRWTRRRAQTAAIWFVVAGWVVFYAVALATADPLPGPATAALDLVVPPLLWVAAVRLVLRHWWAGAGSRESDVDLPGRLLAAAVARLPERRREWGGAMTGELAEVRGRSARWRFALSSARAALWLPPAGGRAALALVTAVVVAAAAAAGPAAGAAAPGLAVFAVTFTALVGAMVLLAVTRAGRLRLPVPAPTVLVAGAVAASIAVTVVFLRREPAAAPYLSPPAAVYLAAVLAGCLWVAVAAPRWLGAGRLAPHLGAAGAVVFAGWFLLAIRTDGTQPPPLLALVFGLVLMAVPIAVFAVPAFVAGRAGRSLRSGLQAAVWTLAAAVPASYAVWLPEALRRHAIDGRTLDGELVAPVGANLPEAVIFCLGIFPVLGLTVGVIGAGLGARAARPPAGAAAGGQRSGR
jgi:hypothetical protein